MAVEASQRSAVDVFLGLFFTSGPEEFVIPFFHRGLPVEYELARSIRVVSQAQRKKLGIVTTDAKLFGGFDFNSMNNNPDWSIVEELRKQYDVEQVSPEGPYPTDLNALLAVMPSTLAQPEMDKLEEAIQRGTPTLIFDDTAADVQPEPFAQAAQGRGPQTRSSPAASRPPQPKGDFNKLLASIGLSWRPEEIVWSGHNPHPAFADAPPEIVFVCRSPNNTAPFNPDAAVSSGLQEVVMLYPGLLKGDRDVKDAKLTRTPLLKTGTGAGETAWDSLVDPQLPGHDAAQSQRAAHPEAPIRSPWPCR